MEELTRSWETMLASPNMIDMTAKYNECKTAHSRPCQLPEFAAFFYAAFDDANLEHEQLASTEFS